MNNFQGNLSYIKFPMKNNLESHRVTWTEKFFGHQNCDIEVHFNLRQKYAEIMKGSRVQPLKYCGQNDIVLEPFVDGSMVSDSDDRESTSGFIINFYSNLVFWCTKKLSWVETESADAEVITILDASSYIDYAACIVGRYLWY